MEVDDVSKVGLDGLEDGAFSVVAIAITGSKKSKYIIKWALENFIPQGDTCFKLLHVYPEINSVPTPMGTSIPISQVRDDIATAFRREVMWQTNEKIIPYKTIFTRRNLKVDIIQIEDDDVSKAISDEVAKCNIKKLVIGSSSTGMFSRGHHWSSKISGCSPSFCTVYVVSKGKLSSVRPANSGSDGMIRDDRSDTSSTTNSSTHSNSSPSERTDRDSTASYTLHSSTAIHVPLIKGKNSNDPQEIEENNDDSTQTSPYARSPTRPLIRFPAFLTRNQTPPLPKSTSASGNYYPPPSSPIRTAEDDPKFSRRNSDFTSAYNHPKNNETPSRSIPFLPSNANPLKMYLETGESEHVGSAYLGLSVSDAHDSTTRVSFSHFQSPKPPTKQFQSLSLKDQIHMEKSTKSPHDFGERDDNVTSTLSISGANDVNIQDLSFKSSTTTENYFNSWTPTQPSNSVAPTSFSSGTQVDVNLELERLRMELRHMQGLYSIAQTEVFDTSQKLNDLQISRIGEEIKLKELTFKEEESKEIAKQEKEKYEAAKREADYAKECAEKESAQKTQAEEIAMREAKEKEKFENTLVRTVHQYQKFSLEEIMSATESFSENYRVGMGSYGTVYKCSLRHTTAAVKVLHSTAAHTNKQFERELEILSKIRHPHLLTLLGACPERGCLVYEYMANGSLEEKLLKNNKTLPLPWFERYRIAQEVASALVFLHTSAKPIIHRDLKPANILLDHNLVSKIGDVGLSTMVQPDPSALHTIYKDTSPVGTLCYIDPEYQRTGMVSPKSDIYALGMVILQLLTAKPAIALTYKVEEAIDDDKLSKILDRDAGEWPVDETKELAVLALKCTEIRSRDRPDLKGDILPTLEKLRSVADMARHTASNGLADLPSHFICPLLKDVMNVACVAADGYTYDREAIEAWLEENDNSPITNEPLPHKHLIPNITLVLAIKEWKSGRR